MAEYAIIGGTGLGKLAGLSIEHREMVRTPYGEPSGPITFGRFANTPVAFMPRHGPGHTIPPHRVNYRANIWGLKKVGIKNVIAVNAVGGISPDAAPGSVLVPDQIIDYTWGRGHTFFEHELTEVVHVDFTHPYTEALRTRLIAAGRKAGVGLIDGGTYGASQGPRLESAAEIDRMARDGCDVVGMTGMPEAGLARELSLSYAACNLVVNWAAGRAEGEISMSGIRAELEKSVSKVTALIAALLQSLDP